MRQKLKMTVPNQVSRRYLVSRRPEKKWKANPNPAALLATSRLRLRGPVVADIG